MRERAGSSFPIYTITTARFDRLRGIHREVTSRPVAGWFYGFLQGLNRHGVAHDVKAVRVDPAAFLLLKFIDLLMLLVGEQLGRKLPADRDQPHRPLRPRARSRSLTRFPMSSPLQTSPSG